MNAVAFFSFKTDRFYSKFFTTKLCFTSLNGAADTYAATYNILLKTAKLLHKLREQFYNRYCLLASRRFVGLSLHSIIPLDALDTGKLAGWCWWPRGKRTKTAFVQIDRRHEFHSGTSCVDDCQCFVWSHTNKCQQLSMKSHIFCSSVGDEIYCFCLVFDFFSHFTRTVIIDCRKNIIHPQLKYFHKKVNRIKRFNDPYLTGEYHIHKRH